MTNTYEMTSANTTRIYLPCEFNDELSLEALKALCENGKNLDDIADITAYLVPHVSRNHPSMGYVLNITTTDGQQIAKKVYVNNSTEEAAAILDRFFEAGAPGLDAEFLECFKQQHTEYCNRCQRYAA